jgi:hypothetical protein
MKKVILTTVIVAVATASVFAQGTVTVNGSSVHVFGPNGLLIGTVGGMSATTTFASLIGAPGSNAPESSLIPGLSVSTFRTGAAAGTLASFTATFNNIAPDAPFGSFEVVAWDNSSGLYPTWLQASTAWQQDLINAGRSQEVTLGNIGGPGNLPPVMPPVSFQIGPYIPEPSAAALIGLGAAAFLYAGRRK